jgi:hypothetical protein
VKSRAWAQNLDGLAGPFREALQLVCGTAPNGQEWFRALRQALVERRRNHPRVRSWPARFPARAELSRTSRLNAGETLHPIEPKATKKWEGLASLREGRDPKVNSLVKKVAYHVKAEQPVPKKVRLCTRLDPEPMNQVESLQPRGETLPYWGQEHVRVDVGLVKTVAGRTKLEEPLPLRVGRRTKRDELLPLRVKERKRLLQKERSTPS